MQATDDMIWRMGIAWWITKPKDTQSEMKYFLFLHCKDCFANAPQCYFCTSCLNISLNFSREILRYYLTLDRSSLCAHPFPFVFFSVCTLKSLVRWPRDRFPVVSLVFSVTYSFRPYHGPGIDSARSENEYQEHFLGVKAAGGWGWQPHHLHVPNVMKSGSLNLLEPSGSHRACYGTPLLSLKI